MSEIQTEDQAEVGSYLVAHYNAIFAVDSRRVADADRASPITVILTWNVAATLSRPRLSIHG